MLGDEFRNIHFLVKRNLRKESLNEWLNLAQRTEKTTCTRHTHKTVWTGQTRRGINGDLLPYPITFKVTERYEKNGELLMFPDVEVETYWCTLPELTS